VQQTIAVTGRHVAIAFADGTALTQDSIGDVFAAALTQAPAGQDRWTATSADGLWRVSGRRQQLGADTYMLLAAAPLADAMRERREAAEAMWAGIPLLLLLAAGGGLWIASAGLRPVTRMAKQAARLPIDGTENLGDSRRDDEVGQLEAAFNGLLTRLRQALHAQRQFMADASHELRTPLAVLRSVVDVTLDREHRDEPEYRDALATAGVQTRRAARLVDDMFMLARADAGGYPLHRVDVYLDELVAECRQSIAAPACERGVSLEVSGDHDVPFVGDEELLRRMILNVLQNAVQHTPRGGHVSAAVARDATTVSVVVADQGPGIAPANRDRKLTKPSLLSLLGCPGGRRAHRGGGGALIGGAAGGAPVEAGVVWP